jgi:hypothetical protein
MQRRVRVTTWLVAVAVLGIVLLGGSTARAKGIAITGGGIKQFGEPFYFYIVEVYLDPGFQFKTGDSFTLEQLAGVHFPASTTGAPGGSPSGPWGTSFTNLPDGLLPNFNPPTTVPFADLTFINGSNVVKNEGTSELYLGEFKVLTAVSLPSLPGTYSVDVDWSAILHDNNGNQVTDSGVVVLSIIPEPATVILLGIGIGAPLCWHVYTRRRAGRPGRVSSPVS